MKRNERIDQGAVRRIMIKTFIPILFVLSAVLLQPLAGASEKQVKPETGGDVQKEQSQESLEEKFRKLGRELDELRAKIGPLAEEAGKEMERYKGEALKKGRQAEDRLEELRGVIEDKWNELSEAMNAAIREFEREFERQERESRRQKAGSSDRDI